MVAVKCALGHDMDLKVEQSGPWKSYTITNTLTLSLSLTLSIPALPLQAALWAVKVRRENIGCRKWEMPVFFRHAVADLSSVGRRMCKE